MGSLFSDLDGNYSADPILHAAPAPSTVVDFPKQENAVIKLLNRIRAGHALQLSLSGGKDSTSVVFLGLEAIRRAAGEGIFTQHYISSSSTGVENAAMEVHLLEMHEELTAYIEKYRLPVEVKLVHPALAATFVVSTVGRGTLPRFPQNGKYRQCSVDWKVAPQQRLARELRSIVLAQTGQEPISVIGTRFEESTERKERMTERGESDELPVRDSNGFLVLSPIANWSLSDVWDTLAILLEPDASPYPPPVSKESIERLFELYRDANEGTCGINLGDGGNKAACGSRFGCWNCTITGTKDKSMESMLREEKYRYMQPLNDLRNLLMATQFDMRKRELLGRTISPAGYIPVRPDVYSLHFRMDLLRYLLSMDAAERDRAEQMEADIITGKVPDSPENRRLANPMFEIVSLQQLAAIDFHWSMHAYAPHAFPALSIWYDINCLGRRVAVPKSIIAPQLTIPSKRWYHVGAFDAEVPVDGLRSYQMEMWNPYLHPERQLTHREVNGEKTVWFDEEDSLEVDAEKACMFITCEYGATMFMESAGVPAIESARFWLNEEIIKLPAGYAARYQHIAKRGQYFAHLAAKLNLSPAEMDAHLIKNSISNAEHDQLLPDPDAVPPQTGEMEGPGLFDLLLAA